MSDCRVQQPPTIIKKEEKNWRADMKSLRTCCEWIEKFRYHPSEREFMKFVQVQTYSSYYLKHLVERWSGKYISNGAFIAAVKFFNLPFRHIYGTPDISVCIFLKKKATLL